MARIAKQRLQMGTGVARQFPSMRDRNEFERLQQAARAGQRASMIQRRRRAA